MALGSDLFAVRIAEDELRRLNACKLIIGSGIDGRIDGIAIDIAKFDARALGEDAFGCTYCDGRVACVFHVECDCGISRLLRLLLVALFLGGSSFFAGFVICRFGSLLRRVIFLGSGLDSGFGIRCFFGCRLDHRLGRLNGRRRFGRCRRLLHSFLLSCNVRLFSHDVACGGEVLLVGRERGLD